MYSCADPHGKRQNKEWLPHCSETTFPAAACLRLPGNFLFTASSAQVQEQAGERGAVRSGSVASQGLDELRVLSLTETF